MIVRSVFHYELEFIHPFADGNGRMGCLWQTLILKQWNPLFADIPVENMIYEHEAAYYQALQESTERSDSASSITFILEMVLDAVSKSNLANDQVERMFQGMGDGWHSEQEIMGNWVYRIRQYSEKTISTSYKIEPLARAKKA